MTAPAAQMPDIAAQAARARIPALLILSAGFGETGPEGEALQKRTVDAAREGGVRIWARTAWACCVPRSA